MNTDQTTVEMIDRSTTSLLSHGMMQKTLLWLICGDQHECII